MLTEVELRREAATTGFRVEVLEKVSCAATPSSRRAWR